MDIQKELEQIVQIIIDTADPAQIILFGSQARGNAGTDSDIDIMIVTRTPMTKSQGRRALLGQLWRQMAHIHTPKDILIYDQQEIEKWRTSQNHIIYHALAEGKLLYEHPKLRKDPHRNG